MPGEKKKHVKNIPRKYIVIVGSIMSGLGKGILTASVGKLLQSRGFSVVPIKFDGYLNVDCGTMNPFRHGEVFVLDDGTEVDMDFGTYERFLNMSLTKDCSITGGKLFQRIITKERKGEYLGRDVQFIPHLTDEIKDWIISVGDKLDADVVMVEVGGTVGDLENGYFLEAVRQLKEEKKDDVLFIQLTYVPSISPGEQKTKPTQHAYRLLRSMGISPEIIVCREDEPLTKEAKEKISLYCSVEHNAIFDDPKLLTVYNLPLVLERQGLYDVVAKKLNLPAQTGVLKEWKRIVDKIKNPKKGIVRIALVGKYTAVKDAYVSVKEALVHACAHHDVGFSLDWIESTKIEKGDVEKENLLGYHGIIVPGGFGKRGIEGKIEAIRIARENNVPYLGLCLGMQLMVVEYARNVCNMPDANSTEFNAKTKYPVIALLPEQERITELGGTMRLGSYAAELSKEAYIKEWYKKDIIYERHRHRYEVNPKYITNLKDHGLIISAMHPNSNVVEMVEWPRPRFGFGLGVQAHVELKSRLEDPSPAFLAFVYAAIERINIS